MSRTSAISKGASLAPHEMSMLLAVLLETECQEHFDIFIKFFCRFVKKRRKKAR